MTCSPKLFCAALALGLALSLSAAQAQLSVTEPIDRIIAVVNDDVITALELTTEITSIKQQLQQQGQRLPPEATLKKQLLERLILRRIQLQMADRTRLRVDDESLNRALGNIAAQNNLGLPEFRDVLERDGMDFALFRENLRKEIIINRLQQRQLQNRIVVTEQEIDNFLANQALQKKDQLEYRVGHILAALPEAANPEQIQQARDKASRLVQALRDGTDFAQTAIGESDSQTALEGGDLGWRRAEALPTLFADWVAQHNVGDISSALRSPSGFHIIKLLETRSLEKQVVVTQTHTRHILIRNSEFSEPGEALAHLKELRQRLQDGADFGQLAKAHSDDPGSAVEGGDLGWVSPGEMVPAFESSMDKLAVSEISEPVRSQYGWHLIEVLERREHDSTEKVRRKNARDTLHTLKLEPAQQTWLRRLRDEAFVEVRL